MEAFYQEAKRAVIDYVKAPSLRTQTFMELMQRPLTHQDKLRMQHELLAEGWLEPPAEEEE